MTVVSEIEIKAARRAFAIRSPEILRRIEKAVGDLMARNINPANRPAPAPQNAKQNGAGPLVRRTAARLIEEEAAGRLLPTIAMQAALGVSPSTLLHAAKLAGVTLPDGRTVGVKTTPRQKRLDALVATYSRADFDRAAFAAEWGVNRMTIVADIRNLRKAGRLPAYAPKRETQ